MKLNGLRLLVALALFWPAAWAHAAVTCTVSSPGFSSAYNPAGTTVTVVQTYLTVTCVNNGGTGTTTFSYSVEANNGQCLPAGCSGGSNQATLNSNVVRYDTYRNSNCSGVWNRNNFARLPYPPPGTMTLTSSIPTSVSTSFWACIPAGQTGATNGIHTDTVTMYLYQGTSGTLLDTSTFPVAIFVGATCSISTAPGSINFNYTSFGPAVNANTTFGATCTNLLPYTMALDTTSGTLLGMNYSLALSATSATGTGLAQTYTVSGTMAGGQAGTCATATCTATQSHTLTISY